MAVAWLPAIDLTTMFDQAYHSNGFWWMHRAHRSGLADGAPLMDLYGSSRDASRAITIWHIYESRGSMLDLMDDTLRS